MSLATRCPACGTIFRVVQDQLKVSEGWVRCGQCHEVFHGIEALFDLDSDPAIAARRAATRGPSRRRPRACSRTRARARPIPHADADRAPYTRAVADRHSGAAGRHAGDRRRARQSCRRRRRRSGRPTTHRPRRSRARATPVSRRPPAPLPPPPSPVRACHRATRGTIAPRFAARLAEESARAQAAAPADSRRRSRRVRTGARCRLDIAPQPRRSAARWSKMPAPSWQCPAASRGAPRAEAGRAADVRGAPRAGRPRAGDVASRPHRRLRAAVTMPARRHRGDAAGHADRGARMRPARPNWLRPFAAPPAPNRQRR